MFTGIVQEIGAVCAIKKAGSVIRLSIDAPKTASRVKPLESVAVNGVCLTVVAAGRGVLTFEIIPETQARSSLKALRAASLVNLESSLSLADRFNGHVVLGHVDATGKVLKRWQRAGELVLEIEIPRFLRRYLVSKGPVTVDGVSLTVGRHPTGKSFLVHLIPETLKATTLARLKIGDRVNLEADYFAKLIAQASGHSKYR